MRISVKSRYGISAMICLAQKYNSGEYVTIISLAARLSISKIYLEQVFSLLKRSELVVSAKGSQGGYRLIKQPKEITAYDVLNAIEVSLFEKTDETLGENEKIIEEVMQINIFKELDKCIVDKLSNITLEMLTNEINNKTNNEGYMFYL